MKTVSSEFSPQTSRPGSAIVWIIVIIVVIVAVNFVSKAKDPLSSLPKAENPVSSRDIHPWQEESRLLQPGQELTSSVFPDQPVIDESIFLEARVEEASGDLDLKIAISSDGSVTGGYSADYNKGTNPKINYNMNGDFEGNIDPSNTYFDEQGEDPSKLFFIAKGQMLIVALNFSSNGGGKGMQDMYVTGWLNPDYTAEGWLVLITGRKTFKTYHWKGQRQKKTSLF